MSKKSEDKENTCLIQDRHYNKNLSRLSVSVFVIARGLFAARHSADRSPCLGAWAMDCDH